MRIICYLIPVRKARKGTIRIRGTSHSGRFFQAQPVESGTTCQVPVVRQSPHYMCYINTFIHPVKDKLNFRLVIILACS